MDKSSLMQVMLTEAIGSGSKKIEFTVPPETISFAVETTSSTYNLFSGNVIEIPRGKNPIQISWSGFFPGHKRLYDKVEDYATIGDNGTFSNFKVSDIVRTQYSTPAISKNDAKRTDLIRRPAWMREDTEWQEPMEATNTIENWISKRKKLILSVATKTDNIFNGNVFISSFKHDWYGTFGDCKYDIELKKWDELVVKIYSKPKDDGSIVTGAPPRQSNPPNKDKLLYVTKKGDNALIIAKLVLGNGAYWKQIVKLNEDIIVDPLDIPEGTTVKIPVVK